jgi:hypothetical protein
MLECVVAPVATSTETGPSGLLVLFAVAALLTGGSATPVPAAAVNVTPCSRGTRTSPTPRGCWHPTPSWRNSRGSRRLRRQAQRRDRGGGGRHNAKSGREVESSVEIMFFLRSEMFRSLYIIRREELCTKCARTTQTSLGA